MPDLKEELELIDNNLLVHILDREKTIYKGYKGNIHDTEGLKAVYGRKVVRMIVKAEISRRDAPYTDTLPITELNCGQYRYSDLRMRLVYTYYLDNGGAE